MQLNERKVKILKNMDDNLDNKILIYLTNTVTPNTESLASQNQTDKINILFDSKHFPGCFEQYKKTNSKGLYILNLPGIIGQREIIRLRGTKETYERGDLTNCIDPHYIFNDSMKTSISTALSKISEVNKPDGEYNNFLRIIFCNYKTDYAIQKKFGGEWKKVEFKQNYYPSSVLNSN